MNIYDQLVRDEGVRDRPYRDTQGHLTIGVGHNLDAAGLCGEAITAQLVYDVEEARNACHILPFYRDLSPARQGVIENMVFNMGLRAFLTFRKFMAAVADGEYERASQEMLDSKWARQVGVRARRLSDQMRTDTWQ